MHEDIKRMLQYNKWVLETNERLDYLDVHCQKDFDTRITYI